MTALHDINHWRNPEAKMSKHDEGMQRTVARTSKCASMETCVRTRPSGVATHTHEGDNEDQ